METFSRSSDVHAIIRNYKRFRELLRGDSILNLYEAMFLFDPTYGATFEACETEIRRIMDRAEAEIVFCKSWDERQLAYRINGRKRGVYVLVYFKAGATKIGGIERDVQLSEHLLRILVLRADGVTPDMMEAALSAQRRGAEEEGDRDGRRSDDDSRGRRPRSRPRPVETT